MNVLTLAGVLCIVLIAASVTFAKNPPLQSKQELREEALENERWDYIAVQLAEWYAKNHAQEFTGEQDEEERTIKALTKAISQEKEKTLLQIRNDLAVAIKGSVHETFYFPTVSGEAEKKNAIIRELGGAKKRLEDEQRAKQEAQQELAEYLDETSETNEESILRTKGKRAALARKEKVAGLFLYYFGKQMAG